MRQMCERAGSIALRCLAVLLPSICLLSCGGSEEHLVVVHLNDTHSQFEPVRYGKDAGRGGLIQTACLLDSVRKAEGEDNVLLLHAGDFSQGTSYYNVHGGMLEVQSLNDLAFDCVCLGNHEFDDGMESLARRLAVLRCPVVCANYDFSLTPIGKYVRPSAVFDRGGKRVGVFGILVDVSTVVAAGKTVELVCGDYAETASRCVRMLRDSCGCDVVIALTHIGIEADKELVRKVAGLDLVTGGHSHTFLEAPVYVEDPDGRKVPVVQCGIRGSVMGEYVFD